MAREGFIYCALDHDRELIKIGFSKDVHNRIRQINTGHVSNLRLYKCYKATQEHERAMLYRLRKYKVEARHAREWFEWNQKVLDIFNHHGEYGFSDSYLNRVLRRNARRAELYKERVNKNRPDNKRPYMGDTEWIHKAHEALCKFSRHRDEFVRASKFVMPQYPSVLESIAQQAKTKQLSMAQYCYASGIVRAYAEVSSKSSQMYSGEFISEKGDKRCMLCKASGCKCGRNLTSKALSHTLFTVYGDEYCIRHGFMRLSKGALELGEIMKNIYQDVPDYDQSNIKEYWKEVR